MAGLAIIGTLVSAVGTIAGGIAANNQAKAQAAQMEQQAREQRAVGTRAAEQRRHETELALSRQQAVAAASGGGAGVDAPTITKIMSDTAGQGLYNEQSDLYVAENRARGTEDQAKMTRAAGKSSLLGSVIGGVGTAASGFAKYKYG